MSDLRNRETAKDAGRRVIWWLVTYLFYVLAYFFTFTTAFPTAASRPDHALAYAVTLAIFLILIMLIM